MSENSVPSISSVRPSESNATVKVAASERGEHAAHDVEKSTRPADIEKAHANQFSNISIHFNVDEETNRLVVVVTERESGRVIRTIPASEFEKLRAGDILKLNV